MNRNKTSGLDGIVIMLSDIRFFFWIDRISEMINALYDSDKIQENLSRYIFMTMLKNPGANEYEIYQTISLMSHISKRIIKILINIACSRIRPAIG